MGDRKVKTIDNAAEVFATGVRNGPLGDLHTGSAMALRNELPFDASGGYEETEEDKLNALLSEVGASGGNGFVSVWKLNEQNKKWEFVVQRNLVEFESEGLPYLAREFGSGDFELRIYNSMKKIHARPKVTISKAAALNATEKPSGNGDTQQLAKVMAEGFQGLATLLAQRPQSTESRTQFLQEMLQMKQLFGDSGRTVDPIDMFTKVAGLFKSMQPREPGEGNAFLELLDRFGPTIAELVTNSKAAAGNTTVATVPAQPGSVALPAARQPQQNLTPEQVGAQKMSLQFKMQLMMLCGEAASDSDPAPYAAIIINKVPRDVLVKLVNSDNWLEDLAAFYPNVRNHAEWFDELRTLIVEELDSETQPESLTGTGSDAIQGANLAQGALHVPVGHGDDEPE